MHATNRWAKGFYRVRDKCPLLILRWCVSPVLRINMNGSFTKTRKQSLNIQKMRFPYWNLLYSGNIVERIELLI